MLLFLATVNKASVKMNVQMSPQDPFFKNLGYIPRSWIAEFLFLFFFFNILRNLHTIFHNSGTILHFPVSAHPAKTVCVFVFDSGHPNGCEVIPHYVLIFLNNH